MFYRKAVRAEQRLDMIVDHKLVVEIKSTLQLHIGAQRQVYNYLRATNLEVGLLLHFGPAPKFYRMVQPMEQRVRRKSRTAHPPKNQSVQSGSSDSSG
ncbi:MAG: GxxExxY protein [Gemmatimonadaceae bacterium]